MIWKREGALKAIEWGLSFIEVSVRNRGSINLYDDRKLAEHFFKCLLDEMYGTNLLVMDAIQANFPAIDLGDEGAKRCFQISSTKDGTKVQHTLDRFAKKGLQSRYGQLEIIVIGERQGTYGSVVVPAGVTFATESHIKGMPELMKEINDLGTESLISVANVIEAEVKVALHPKDDSKQHDRPIAEACTASLDSEELERFLSKLDQHVFVEDLFRSVKELQRCLRKMENAFLDQSLAKLSDALSQCIEDVEAFVTAHFEPYPPTQSERYRLLPSQNVDLSNESTPEGRQEYDRLADDLHGLIKALEASFREWRMYVKYTLQL